ncbi:Meiotic recombination protein SPO11, partial [Ophiophagus hannah]
MARSILIGSDFTKDILRSEGALLTLWKCPDLKSTHSDCKIVTLFASVVPSVPEILYPIQSSPSVFQDEATYELAAVIPDLSWRLRTQASLQSSLKPYDQCVSRPESPFFTNLRKQHKSGPQDDGDGSQEDKDQSHDKDKSYPVTCKKYTNCNLEAVKFQKNGIPKAKSGNDIAHWSHETDWSSFTLLDQHHLALRKTSANAHVASLSCEISSSEVLRAIENVIEDVIMSLSKSKAPILILRNRSDWGNIHFTEAVGLQMISNCTTQQIRSDNPKSATKFALCLKILSIIYKMVQTNTDIFYTDTVLFGNQRVVDNIINDISCMLKIPRRTLHILSTSKGCIAGNLSYIEEDGTKTPVPSNVEGIRNLITDAKFILIIEKDATFQRLLDDNFCCKMSPSIIITGKGVPDINTRLLVRKLWDNCHVPIFALMDADPHGIEIMSIYKYGSVSMSFEAHRLTVPAVRWLGLLPSDVYRLNVPKSALIPLTKEDQSKLTALQARPYIAHESAWKKELDIMETSKMKAEIQALTSFSTDYLSRIYLPNKLQFGRKISDLTLIFIFYNCLFQRKNT